MADIFISYKREDKVWVEALAEALELQGWSVWWDTRLTAGVWFDEVIEAELIKARCVMVLWSTASIKSRWVRDEARKGLEGDILLPVLIEDIEPPLGYGSIQAEDFTGWNKESTDPEFARLIASITNLIGPPPDSRDTRPEELSSNQIASDDYGKWARLSGVAIPVIALIFWLVYWLFQIPPVLPTASLSALKTHLILGDSTRLSWITSHATIVKIEPDIGITSDSGSQFVSPKETTTYILKAEGNEVAMDTLVIMVDTPAPEPQVWFQADHRAIIRGESTWLRWRTANVTSVRIDPVLGDVDLEGSYAVKPSRTTMFTLTAKGERVIIEKVTIVVRDG